MRDHIIKRPHSWEAIADAETAFVNAGLVDRGWAGEYVPCLITKHKSREVCVEIETRNKFTNEIGCTPIYIRRLEHLRVAK